MNDAAIPEVLPDEVCARIRTLPRGHLVLACLRTAVHFVQMAGPDGGALRWAESSTYNVREAFDAVVSGAEPARTGAAEAKDAWVRYRHEVESGGDEPVARSTLTEALDRAFRLDVDLSYRDAQLLTFFRDRSAAGRLVGALDPVTEYSRLRNESSAALHGSFGADAATLLVERTLSWFVRMFTPPDEQALATIELAARPYEGPDQLPELKQVIASPHLLRLFLSRVEDSRWLAALHGEGMIPPAERGELWPLTGLLDSLARTAPDAVADLLVELLDDAATGSPEPSVTYYEVSRIAWQLGPAGHPVTAAAIQHSGGSSAVLSIANQVALDADPAAPIVVIVARALIGTSDSLYRRRGAAPEVLDRVVEGLTRDNARDRVRFLAGNLRALSASPAAGLVEDVASLWTDLDSHHGPVPMLAHYLVRAAGGSRQLGFTATDVQGWIGALPGSTGERVGCQVLAGAADEIPLADKIDHVVRRLSSNVATGDDRDLVDSVLAAVPDSAMLEPWRAALGRPSEPASEPQCARDLPVDWARVWRWSVILPHEVLVDWEHVIRVVTTLFGEPGTAGFNTRLPRFHVSAVESPIAAAELARLDADDAARRISSWRPDDPDTSWNEGGAEQLANTLRDLVESDPRRWAANPALMVELLGEPLYLQRYLEGLTSRAGEIVERAPAVLDALTTLDAWGGFDDVANRLIRAFANADADIGDRLNEAWERAARVVRGAPVASGVLDVMGDRDALHSAINRPWGQALQTLLSLTRWEAVHTGVVHPRFAELLDTLLSVTTDAGIEFRAVLAASRVHLEVLVPAWLEENAGLLFREPELGPATFDLTLRWSRPTDWLFTHFGEELIDAVLRGVENALPQLLIAVLHERANFTIPELIRALRPDTEVLRAAIEEVPTLVQNSDRDAPELLTAIRFWQEVLDGAGRSVPSADLAACGRWAFVDNMPDLEWLQHLRRTAELTGGAIDYPIEVADRCAGIDVDETVLAVLLLIVDKGEPWQRSYVQDRAAEVLRVAVARPDVPTGVDQLWTRLLELGRTEVLDLDGGEPS